MTSLGTLLQQGTMHAWLFIPTAILLGVLHGLEPGHSKTMMAAFIIAIRGTVGQAVLLGLCAAASHTAVVWVVALGGQYLGRGMNAEAIEPYLQIVSAVIVVGVGAWMIWRTWRDQRMEQAGHAHHHHGQEARKIETGHGIMTLQVFEDGVPPRWRVHFDSGSGWKADDVSVTTRRPDNSEQAFGFTDHGGYLESVDEIPEPHEFVARISLGHGRHSHDYDVAFIEHEAGHDHMHEEARGLKIVDGGQYMDAHERAHASDIETRFKNRSVTNGQIVKFGLPGGLVPCPAAITVLLLCLQLKQISLGAVLVACFSIGLAVTMVSAGVIASLSVKHISKRWSGFGTLARRAPYASGGLMAAIALYMAVSGFIGLNHGHLGG